MHEPKDLQEGNCNTEIPEATKCEDGGRSSTDEKRKEEAAHKVNPDSEGLGWYGNDRIVIGCVDEVNGPGSIEFPSFVPTRHELVQLAKYWASVRMDLDFSHFIDGQTGSSEIRLGPFASRRIARIAAALGEDEVAKAVNEAYDEFGKRCDPRTWKVFREGTPEEQKTLQAEIAREMSGIEDPQVVAGITELMKSLSLDYLVAGRKAARFAILSSPAAAVSDPACIIVPVLEYLNAGPSDGRYRKKEDGSVPPIEWEIRFVGLSRIEMMHIQRLPDPGKSADDVDIVMMSSESESGREFDRAAKRARWRNNPELVLEVEKAAVEASNALAAKVAGRNGVTMFDDFRAASIALG